MNKYVCIIYVYISLIFNNIANIASLAHNSARLGTLLQGTLTFHETPLHNLNDVADLGAESNGTKNERLHELEEILEDESQSPDEQSASKYEENVKVFDNPVVLEATSNPTEDEVKDFQKVRQHELLSEDKHFDALSTLISEPKLFEFVKGKLSKDANKGENPAPSVWETSPKKLTESNFGSPGHELGSNHKPDEHNSFTGGFGKSNSFTGSDNAFGSEPFKPVDEAGHNGLLSKMPPVNVNADTRNTFHVFNVHHHYPHLSEAPKYPEGLKFSQGFLSKECFENHFEGQSGEHCYCSKNAMCRCTKTYMMLVAICDTLVNDSYLKEFCSFHDVKRDHPMLNHRFAKSKDSLVSDAFNSVHASLCNYKSFGFCKNILEMDKLCQCTRCD